ncbi:beta-propeller domain-containing protein [Thalassotalea crassostreae]|uniref:beta-propeller domain-containing protein n=1 Tax=Thalassotalea crassostreae TaxID=1763536 RepID=UPI00083856F1|nr:beta-propeller domain-containing protein [Thalassotalea crassostreae]
MNKFALLTTIIVVNTLMLQGCGGSDSNVVEDNAKLKNIEGVDEISPIYKNAIVRSLSYRNDEIANNPVADAEAVSDGTDSNQFSETNTQESGVDEADRVEFNGEHLFLLTSPQYKSKPTIKAFEKSASKLSYRNTVMLSENSHYQGLYLFGNTLTAIGESYNHYYSEPLVSDQQSGIGQYQYQPPIVMIDIIDDQSAVVSNQEFDKHQFKISGSLVNSRRVDNELYVVTRFSPNFTQYDDIYYGQTPEELKDAVEQIDAQDLLATYQYGNEEAQLLTSNCYLEDIADNDESLGYQALIYVVKINLEQPEQIQSVCIGAESQQIYSSTNSLVLFNDIYQYTDNSEQSFTQMHKFNLTTLNYQSSGQVPGAVGWNNASYRFSEQDDYLRVITTERNWRENTIEHKLFVLDTSNFEMSEVARLPEDGSEQTIGKPGEDIYAVRYRDNKAYVVTFRRTDPLYVIDLSEPANPTIEGQLEIPGYSAYLHPVDENLLIGIGRQTDGLFWGFAEVIDTRADGDKEQEQWQFPQALINDETLAHGAKISLFDISDPTSPSELITYTYPGTQTEVEYDFHAFTSLNHSDGSMSFTVPLYVHQYIETFDEMTNQWDYRHQYKSSLELFEVDNSMLDRVGAVQPEYEEDLQSRYGHRSIIDGDNVYFVDGNDLWQASWSNPSDAVKVQ